jgi:hypothetical protein
MEGLHLLVELPFLLVKRLGSCVWQTESAASGLWDYMEEIRQAQGSRLSASGSPKVTSVVASRLGRLTPLEIDGMSKLARPCLPYLPLSPRTYLFLTGTSPFCLHSLAVGTELALEAARQLRIQHTKRRCSIRSPQPALPHAHRR